MKRNLSNAILTFTGLFLLLVTVSPAAAQQSTTGVITGRVTDSTNALIPGVGVSVSSPAMIGGSRTSITNERGEYRFNLLPPGTYRVTFTLQGFKTLNVDGVNVTVGSTMTINGRLEVATIAESVTVTSEAPTIDLEAATKSVNWNEQSLENLPYGRAIRGLVQMVPGLQINTYDIGGNTKGGPAGPGARAYGLSRNDIVTYDGAVWDQTFGDYASFQEVEISAAAKGAEAMNPGVSMNFIVKSGGNDFHGSVYGDWQDDSFQSNNVDQALLDRGFAAGGNKFTRFNEFNFTLGGPIIRDKFWFYGSYGDMYSGLQIPGFIDDLGKQGSVGNQATFYTSLKTPTLKLTYQLNDKIKLESMATLNRKHTPYRDGSDLTPLSATQDQLSWSGTGPKLKMNYIINPRMTLDAGVSRSGYWWPSTAHTSDIRITDRTTRQTRGAFGGVYRRPIRWQEDATFAWFKDIAGRANEIKLGYLTWWNKNFTENMGYPNQQLYRYRSLPGDTNLFARPDSVQVFDYPNFVADIEYYNSFYLSDKINLSRKLTANIGMRLDRWASALPEQGNPGSGPFAVRNLFPERHDFPVYNALTPRFSFVYDVTGRGRVALKASYGRYVSQPDGSPAPTGSDVNPAATTTWTYRWDGSIPYTPQSADLLSVSGGGGTGSTLRLDDNLEMPRMDEYTAGIELGFTRDSTLRFNVVRKQGFGGWKTLNLAQPFSAYTDVRYAVDPGRDNIEGTNDDGIIQAWSVPRSDPNFGKIDRLVTRLDSDQGKDLYTSYEVTFNKQYSSGWSFLASYQADFSKVACSTSERGNGCSLIPQNPNQLLYNRLPPEWNYALKFSGQYSMPHGLMYSSSYRANSGEYFNREVLMTNALGSTVVVQAEAHAGRYDWVNLWDNRVSKTFRLNDRNSIEAMFDLFNSLNANTVLQQETQNGPNYHKPIGSGGATVSSAILAPRIFRLAMRWRF